MEETAVCPQCGRLVNTSNLLVHEVRCARNRANHQPRTDLSNEAMTTSNVDPRSSSLEHTSTDVVEASAPMTDENTFAQDTFGSLSEQESWTCDACTFINSPFRTRCEACNTIRGSHFPTEEHIRPPDRSYRDCLVEDNFYNSNYPPPAQPRSNSSVSSLLTGAVIGALGGGLLSYLRGGSMRDGALSGTGYGVLTSALVNEFGGGSEEEEVFRGRPVTQPPTNLRQHRHFTHTITSPVGTHTFSVLGGEVNEMLFPFPRDAGMPYSDVELMFLRNLARSRMSNQHEHGGALDVDNMSYEELLQRFGDHSPQPASRSSIASLPTRSFTADDKRRAQGSGSGSGSDRESCLVCLAAFEVGDDVKSLPCLHSFHTECIDRWLATSGMCPVCKIRITADAQQLSDASS